MPFDYCLALASMALFESLKEDKYDWWFKGNNEGLTLKDVTALLSLLESIIRFYCFIQRTV